MGGKVAGQRRHRRSLQKAVAECERFLTREFKLGLSADQLARVRVLMARSFERGHSLGARKTDANRRYWQKKASAA